LWKRGGWDNRDFKVSKVSKEKGTIKRWNDGMREWWDKGDGEDYGQWVVVGTVWTLRSVRSVRKRARLNDGTMG
jgi:hypothetical protein